MKKNSDILAKLLPFDRRKIDECIPITRMGSGEIGGKAHGLLSIQDFLKTVADECDFEEISVCIPRMIVLTTEIFDLFMERNALYEIAFSDSTDTRIADAFNKGTFPNEYIGDIMALAESMHTPIAVRSSSRLEDALYRPFAGVYGTKMVPNNQFSSTERFHCLIDAIKFVFASTYFREAKAYVKNTEETIQQEKMAVILQEVVGNRYGERFYPELSGVARSHNFYAMNWVRPKDGVIDLALGLGKTVVDGEATWSYCPNMPHISPPFNTVSDMLKHTQLNFWAVNMGKPPEYDPINEAEYLVHPDLTFAEQDGTLRYTASTYNHQSGRITPGISEKGPRILNFAPILQYEQIPINELMKRLLSKCEAFTGNPVEIEFAVALDPEEGIPARVGFLQIRPIVVDDTEIAIEGDIEGSPNVLLASDSALGNGIIDTIEHIIYVKPDKFEWKHTWQIASELEKLNERVLRERRNSILIGFGRWGTTDEWRGIPVHVGQISTARVIVEATLPGMTVDPSQGSHFFHNITSFRVLYFSVPHSDPLRPINWDWLEQQPIVQETEFARLVKSTAPLTTTVDGRTRQGVIRYG